MSWVAGVTDDGDVIFHVVRWHTDCSYEGDVLLGCKWDWFELVDEVFVA